MMVLWHATFAHRSDGWTTKEKYNAIAEILLADNAKAFGSQWAEVIVQVANGMHAVL